MEKQLNVKDQILDTAEQLIQTRGFNDFSFRDLAQAVGIKSPSIHHHYRTKEDLGVAVTARYTSRFIQKLKAEQKKTSNPKKLINFYIMMFRQSLVAHKQMCLCGMLGAEIDSLPTLVAKETKVFFDENIEWLTTVFSLSNTNTKAEIKAKTLVAMLEGALILSRTRQDHKSFDEITKKIADNLLAE